MRFGIPKIAFDTPPLTGEGDREGAFSRPGVFIKTFGCQMNEYDSEKILALLSGTYRPVEDPLQAEVVIVNTCSVREKGEHKLFSYLGALRELKESRPDMIIGVGGCVAQQEGERILAKSPAVDFVVGTHNLSLVPSLVARVKDGYGPAIAVDYRDEWEELPEDLEESAPEDRERLGLSPAVLALVAIQRGCDKRCSFCVVPNTRGPQVSRPAEEIVREVRMKARLGAREVLLLGQTVNSYGIDLSPRLRFEDLIRRIAEIEGIARIRFISPHPAEVRRSFIKLYSEVPQLCKHIHLPLQSGSDRVLQLMNRNYKVSRYLSIVDELKTACRDIAISSDIIVGFPTETEEDFQATLDVVNCVSYNSSFSFKYSRRPGTAALNFAPEDEILSAIASRRLSELQKLQDQISERNNAQKVGSVVQVLVERINKKISSSVKGRISQNTWVEIRNAQVRAGAIVGVRITDSNAHSLGGVLLEDAA